LRFVGKSVGNKFTDGFTKRQNMPKKISLFILSVFLFIRQYIP